MPQGRGEASRLEGWSRRGRRLGVVLKRPSRRASSAPHDEAVGICSWIETRRLRPARNVGIYPRMETTCYCAAVRTAARKTTALYDSILEPAGVTLAQFSLLRKIKRAGTVSLTGLGRLADLDRSTIGRNVKALEKLRLVSMASAEDHREAAVRLTPEGERALRRRGSLVGRSPAAGRGGAGRDRSGAAADARA